VNGWSLGALNVIARWAFMVGVGGGSWLRRTRAAFLSFFLNQNNPKVQKLAFFSLQPPIKFYGRAPGKIHFFLWLLHCKS
jgi:hypothetical protein